MGVPSEKASSAAAVIRSEAEYLRQLDPIDIHSGAIRDMQVAMELMLQTIMRAQGEVTNG